MTERDASDLGDAPYASSPLGTQGHVVTSVLPALELLIGPQPPVPELGPREAKNRFHRLVRMLLDVFGQLRRSALPPSPLVLFLDDLQWPDAGSCELLDDLVRRRSVGNLLLVGAYRDDEIGEANCFALIFEARRHFCDSPRNITREMRRGSPEADAPK